MNLKITFSNTFISKPTNLRSLGHPHPILALKLRTVLLEVLPDLLLLFGRQQGRGSRSPQEVTESIYVVALDDLALERPDPVTCVHLSQRIQTL